ncbi:NtaA/DmoA family FMN-dependent monooxygenase [Curtobacterium pusillum]|uniref:NtaA/DmoA family FMN-dependent monooxygenase n=1 Tax=Curtobacterium pusillum TaxID=69373 RepID=UPI0011A31CD5|nr:NtaA/DmoA family FMN-dependent monooxygenase [Curtobacterium pusillum]
MAARQMILGIQMTNGWGNQPGAWRLPGAAPRSFMDMDAFVRHARAAERGKLQFLFLADTPVLDVDLTHQPSMMPLEPFSIMASVFRETSRIGMVATASTTFNEPYNIARQFKALDVISHGRVGWNAVTTSSLAAAANFGAQVPPRAQKYARAHEMVQIVEALWGSWEEDALIADVESGVFADPSKIQPINLQGQYVGARGPLPIPPSEQGQPVIFQAGGGANGLDLAGRYADGVYANPYDIETSRSHRQDLRAAAVTAGRNPDDVKVFPGLMPTLAATKELALARRRRLDESIDIRQRVSYLGAMIGVPLDALDIDQPVPEPLRERAVASLSDPRSDHALAIVRQGWSIRDVIAHGVIDYHPVVAGTAVEVADHMQEWFEAEACDGFSLEIDAFHDGIDAFVDEVVPLLQARGLFHLDYEGATLREHLGAAPRYGRDPRTLG